MGSPRSRRQNYLLDQLTADFNRLDNKVRFVTEVIQGKLVVNNRRKKELLEELVSFPRRANTDPAASWIDALSGVRLGLRSPAAVEAEFKGDVEGFAAIFDRTHSYGPALYAAAALMMAGGVSLLSLGRYPSHQ